MIFDILAVLPLFAGLQFILTVIVPAFVALFGVVYLLERVEQIIYKAGVDYLELVARLDGLRDDHAKRDLTIAEAGLALRARRLELQSKRLELND